MITNMLISCAGNRTADVHFFFRMCRFSCDAVGLLITRLKFKCSVTINMSLAKDRKAITNFIIDRSVI